MLTIVDAAVADLRQPRLRGCQGHLLVLTSKSLRSHVEVISQMAVTGQDHVVAGSSVLITVAVDQPVSVSRTRELGSPDGSGT